MPRGSRFLLSPERDESRDGAPAVGRRGRACWGPNRRVASIPAATIAASIAAVGCEAGRPATTVEPPVTPMAAFDRDASVASPDGAAPLKERFAKALAGVEKPGAATAQHRCLAKASPDEVDVYVEYGKYPLFSKKADGSKRYLWDYRYIALRVPAVSVAREIVNCNSVELGCRLASPTDGTAQYEYGTDLKSTTGQVVQRGDDLIVEEASWVAETESNPSRDLLVNEVTRVALPCGAHVRVHVTAPTDVQRLYSSSGDPTYSQFGWPPRNP